jgi:hypothetical protein
MAAAQERLQHLWIARRPRHFCSIESDLPRLQHVVRIFERSRGMTLLNIMSVASFTPTSVPSMKLEWLPPIA